MKALNRIIKKPFFGRFMVPWKNPIPEDKMATWETNWLTSGSGGRIRAWHGTARSEALGVLILGHSMGKRAKGDFLKTGYADQLRDAGYHVFLFDFNGFGESSIGSFQFDQDLEAVIQWAKASYPNLPMGYHGISFGSNWGSVVAAKEGQPFKRVILESAPVNLPEFWEEYPAAYRMLNFMFFFSPKARKQTDFEAAVGRIRNLDKLLLIYSDTDTVTPLSYAHRMQAASQVPTQLEVFPNGEHTKIIASDPERYLNLVLEHWRGMQPESKPVAPLANQL